MAASGFYTCLVIPQGLKYGNDARLSSGLEDFLPITSCAFVFVREVEFRVGKTAGYIQLLIFPESLYSQARRCTWQPFLMQKL